MTVHGLGDGRAAVPDQVADVLQPDIMGAQDGHERVPQFAGRPCPAEPGGPCDLLELLPYVPAVQRRSVLAAEDEIVLRAYKRFKKWWTRVISREPRLFAHWAWTRELAGLR